jgi:hypothetical protein
LRHVGRRTQWRDAARICVATCLVDDVVVLVALVLDDDRCAAAVDRQRVDTPAKGCRVLGRQELELQNLLQVGFKLCLEALLLAQRYRVEFLQLSSMDLEDGHLVSLADFFTGFISSTCVLTPVPTLDRCTIQVAAATLFNVA